MANLLSTTITGTLITTSNVGIGTTFSGINTGSLLTIKASVAEGNQIYIVQSNDDRGWRLKAKTDGHFYLQSAYVSANSDVLVARFDTGNVGIGTTSPSTKLHVDGTMLTTATLNSTAGSYSIDHPGINTWKIGVTSTNTSTFHIGNDTGGSFANKILSITAGGNVGIGTTSPISGLATPLTLAHPDGYVGITLLGTGAYAHTWQLYASGDGGSNKFFGIYDRTNGAYRLVTTSSGNVGIGTTAPGAKLDVNGEVFISPNTAGKNTFVLSTNASNDGRFLIKSDTTTKVDIQANGISYFNGGNVGIGTTAPSNLLSIGGQSHTSPDNTNRILNFYIVGSELHNSVIPAVVGNNNNGTTQPEMVGLSLFNRSTTNNTWSPMITFGGLSTSGNYMNGAAGIAAQLPANTDDNNFRGGNLVFYTAGTSNGQRGLLERVRITSAGNVGIGTTAPTQLLHILGTNAANNGLTIQNTNASGNSQVRFLNTSGTERAAITYVNSVDAVYFYLASAGNILNLVGSNVGIGTTAPEQKLHVEGTIQLGNQDHLAWAYDNGSYYNYITNFYDTSTGMAFRAGSWTGGNNVDFSFQTYYGGSFSTKLAIKGDGNVGIGTNDPQDKLEIKQGYLRMYDPSSGVGAGYLLQWSSNNGGSNVTYAGIDAITTNAGVRTGDLRFLTSNAGGPTEKMRITSAGNVGIGTTSTSGYRLKVQTTGATGISIQTVGSDSGNPHLQMINGAIDTTITASSNGLELTAYSGHSLLLKTSNTERMRITSAGNVGIGTTSPGSKLSISGSNTGSVPLVDLIASGSGGFQRGVRMLNSGMVAGDSIMYSAGNKDSSKNMGQFYFHFAGDGSNSNRISMGLHSVDDVFNITGAGNVGIGTTSPGQKLQVVGNAWINRPSNKVDNSGATEFGSRVEFNNAFAAGSTGYVVFNYPSASVFRIYADYDGNIGGLQPDLQLGLGYLTVKSTGGTIGNVGIGTTSPSDKLDVSGNARTSGFVLVNNHSDNTLGYRIANTSGTSVSAMFTNSSNALVIAAGAVDQINLNKKVYVNAVALGVNFAPSATAGRIDASNDIVAFNSSDERLKENITPIANALDKVKSLTGVEFDWKPEHKEAHGHEGRDTGIIAQQVLAVMPTAVRTNDTGYLAVRYEKLIGLLIEANKELAARVEELEKKLG